jgi:phage terminase large subunit-like protein
MAGRMVRLACERHVRDLKRKDLVWMPEKAFGSGGVVDFFESMLTLEDGASFKPLPFQRFILGSLFGWYAKDGMRRFRTAYIETGKGSGKTPLAAGVGLYGLIADGEPSPEIYSAATMREQAKICFGDAVRMVGGESELQELVSVQVGSLTIPGRCATFRPVSSEHKGLDGLRPHIGLVDELHEHPTALVVDKIRAGIKRRKNALIFEITNSGWDRTSVCWQHHEYSTKVLDGTADNDQWFAYVCQLDEGDQWTDERVWIKANPGMEFGLPPKKYLREQVEEAKGMPSKENIVRRLNFCEWTEQADRWLDMAEWDACLTAPIRPEEIEGQPCMGGLDAGSTSDLTAFVLVFEGEAGERRVLSRFWLPERSLAAENSGRSEEDRIRLKAWVDQGWIKTTEGDTTDYDVVERDILDLLSKYRLRRLSFDRWNVTQLVTHLIDALGEQRIVAFPQTLAAMSAPTKELERLVRDRKIHAGGNPVLRWMASNVALMYGPNEQIKPDKAKSGEKIDGIVALVMALDGWMRDASRQPTSIYEQRGLLTL